MGDGNSVTAEPLWRQYRSQFPVTENLVYLNHAAIGPLCRPAAEAMQWFTDDAQRFGSLHYDQWLAAYEGLRAAAAKLIHAHRDEIAIVKNTSEGVATVALGLDWCPGDTIIAFKDEFPANQYPWRRLEETRDVQIEWLRFDDSLEVIEKAAKNARLLAISFVQYLSGYRADLEAIGRICRDAGCFFFVDAIQGLGAFPLDVEACHIDAMAADGHKWLLGPEGCGLLYIRRDRLPQIDPVEFGWTNSASFNDYESRDMSLRPDAGRYECGTLSTIGCFGLQAAIEFLLEIGIEKIAPAVSALADQVAEGALQRGYEIFQKQTQFHSSGIVSIRKPCVDSGALVASLKAQGIVTASRQGWVRVAPHFYISPEEIGRFVSLLP